MEYSQALAEELGQCELADPVVLETVEHGPGRGRRDVHRAAVFLTLFLTLPSLRLSCYQRLLHSHLVDDIGVASTP